MAFTEFCCRSGGSNLNGGGLASGAEPATSAVYTCTNSNWNGTSIFTPTDGSTPASTVTVGDFASVYLDGATVAVYIARVVTVAAGVNGAITLDTTAKSGTAPTSGATGRTIKVGGAWKGPNAAEAFPFAFITSTLTNTSGDTPRVNMKNDATYSITAGMTQANANIRFQGYTTAFADGGRAIIDGTFVGASFALITLSATNDDIIDIILQNNGTTGSANAINITGAENFLSGVVANNVRGSGFSCTTASILVECEAYACNTSNTASIGGFNLTAGLLFRCISHDNTGSNSHGFILSGGNVFFCIGDTNGSHGLQHTGTVTGNIQNCDFYNNTGDGIRLANASAAAFYIENCNLVKNGGWGINGSGAGLRNGSVRNCGFGTGSQVNTSGTVTGLKSMSEIGSINYASGSTPWTDPDNGDFKVNLAAAINAGRGTFTETAASYSGAVGYPDIGAVQHQESGGGGGGGGMLPEPGMNGGLI